MKTNVSFRRIPVVSGTFIAALLLGPAALAQSVFPVEPGPELERMDGIQTTDAVAFTFEGFVLAPDGTPAEGAVVVSSAGGQAVTDAAGSFQFDARVPAEAERVQVTAVGGAGGNLVASQQVSLYASSTPAWSGSLQLTQAGTCTPSWLPTFGGEPGTNGRVHALTVFDDGGGAALYAGGWFTSAGGVVVQGIAKWDGLSWSTLGSGMSGHSPYVYSLTVFDDGGGEALYAGGSFTGAGGVAASRIAKWDGSSWSALGSGLNSEIRALTVFDDGSGAALYAGGNGVAWWDGSNWSTLGSVMTGLSPFVYALSVFDDGGGEALYAGGNFTGAGGVAANYIAKLDGSSWAALGSGLDSSCRALTVFDDGGGEALYAGGDFTSAGGVLANRVAKWDGSSWAALGSGVSSGINALMVFDDGGGAALYAGGDFTSAGGVAANYIAAWDGSSWSTLGSGLSGNYPFVSALAVFDDGGGKALYAGDDFTSAGGVAAQDIAKWDGSSWTALGSGMNSDVWALTVFDDGGGEALYAGGDFTSAGGVAASWIAKWDGSSWSALGSGVSGGAGVDGVRALTVFDDGGGVALYAGGNFTSAGGVAANSIAKWDGSSWSTLGSGMNSAVNALTVFDDGSGEALYAGGWFSTAGGLTANRIAKWDGSSWSTLGSGLTGTSSYAYSLSVFDDGGGAALYAGGSFTSAGGMAASRIAKWDGSSWSALGSGMETWGYPWVAAITVFDDGSGAALYAGGYFTTAGGVAANGIAKWDGSTWAALGSGVTGAVLALRVFDDGGGAALYVGGGFHLASGLLVSDITKWDGSSWSALGSGMNNDVTALTIFDDGGGPALYAGGEFSSAIDSGDSHIAKWGCPTSGPTSYCAPAGANSVSAGGSVLTSTGNFGTATATFDLVDVPDQPGLLYAGSATSDMPFGCGRRCVGGSTIRGSVFVPSGNQALGVTFDMSPATAINIQYWYRDPANFAACGSTVNLSNALMP